MACQGIFNVPCKLLDAVMRTSPLTTTLACLQPRFTSAPSKSRMLPATAEAQPTMSQVHYFLYWEICFRKFRTLGVVEGGSDVAGLHHSVALQRGIETETVKIKDNEKKNETGKR